MVVRSFWGACALRFVKGHRPCSDGEHVARPVATTSPFRNARPMSTATGERTADERRELLASAVRKHVRSGYRVESQTDFQAVVVKGRRPNHLLHLILSIITIGIWFLFVWLPLMIFGGEKRRVLTVDTSGKINRARGRG